MKIEIEWINDYIDCETCGGSGATGAVVTIDGTVALDFTPSAQCFDSVSWEEHEIHEAILIFLGHELSQTRTQTGYDDDDDSE